MYLPWRAGPDYGGIALASGRSAIAVDDSVPPGALGLVERKISSVQQAGQGVGTLRYRGYDARTDRHTRGVQRLGCAPLDFGAKVVGDPLGGIGVGARQQADELLSAEARDAIAAAHALAQQLVDLDVLLLLGFL